MDPPGGSDMAGPLLTTRACDRCKTIYMLNTADTKEKDVPQLCPKCKKGWDALHEQHNKKPHIMTDTLTVDTISLDAPFNDIVSIDAPVTGTVMKKDSDWPTAEIHVSKEIWDKVFAPAHYVDGRKYEPSKVAYDWDLDGNCTAALKYISRLGRKKGATYEEDICKAIRFLMLELEAIQDHRN